jgi:amino acid transporter
LKEKNLGLGSVIATGVGLIVATSCLLSLGQGASAIGTTIIISMVIACVLNILTALSISELNAIMPNLTGGLAQYTLAGLGPFVTVIAMVGGYLVCNTIVGSAEVAMFGNTLSTVLPDFNISGTAYCIGLLVVLMIVNLNGVDMFAKIQNLVAYGLIISLMIMGITGALKIGSGQVISQPAVLFSDFSDIAALCGLTFFLFIGCEFIVPISNQVKNPRKNVPLGMILSLVIVMVMQTFLVFGFKNYTDWADLGASTTPHVLYGTLLLGNVGTIWMAIVSILAVTSSINTIIASLAYICVGMAKIKLLPSFFMKTNKKGAPYVGILAVGGSILLIVATGLSTTDQLSFIILTGCVFWMVTYIIAHIDVLILRKRMPKVPRTFKVPLGPVLPVIGIIGIMWMIYNIAFDPSVRVEIYKTTSVIFTILAVYAVVWIKVVMKVKLFKPFAVKDVMAMENELYHAVRDKNYIPEENANNAANTAVE